VAAGAERRTRTGEATGTPANDVDAVIPLHEGIYVGAVYSEDVDPSAEEEPLDLRFNPLRRGGTVSDPIDLSPFPFP
jgi:hypothetical protein